jgi:hypothetical protein
MSPFDHERFIKIMSSRFRHVIVDEFWGPVAPNVRAQLGVRELRLAYGVASQADALEAAQEGLGMALLRRFADEPEGICPPWPPFHIPHGGGGGPGPSPEPEPIDKAVLGAALVFVSEFLGSEALASFATKSGAEMIG